MHPASSLDANPHSAYTKRAGLEPLPGYTLLEPLGRGGFGEVWKCEAPGGLHKAVKFVPGGEGHQLQQELEAFEQIKAIRHPFLLTLERVELLGGDLVMVMELADRQLLDRYQQCVAEGLPGIPRDELLGYLADAAEALDMISAQYGLQHLDIKPANLFVTSGRVKVGDYGLVSRLEGGDTARASGNKGLTPKYVSPEVLRGTPSLWSDQYSLALVYQELLTGTFPYPARTAQQLMMQHIVTPPTLTGLPECDRPAVGQALAKKPEGRFPSCMEFVRALLTADPMSMARPTMMIRQSRLDQSIAAGELTGRHRPPVDPAARTRSQSGNAGPLTQNSTLKTLPSFTRPAGPLPPLISAGQRPLSATPPPVARNVNLSTPEDAALAEAEEVERVILKPIRSLVSESALLGQPQDDGGSCPLAFISTLVEAAAAGAHVPQIAGDLGRHSNGTWECRFPSTVPATVAPIKLAIVAENWGVTIDTADPYRLVLRKAVASGGLWSAFSGKPKSGLEISVGLPKPGRPIGEVILTGGLYGTPDASFARAAQDAIPKIITDVRRELGNVGDRRKYSRVPATLPFSLYPIHSDGGIDTAIPCRTRDLSAGGMAFSTSVKVPTKYAFAVFSTLRAVAGTGILVELVRSVTEPVSGERTYGIRFRTDF